MFNFKNSLIFVLSTLCIALGILQFSKEKPKDDGWLEIQYRNDKNDDYEYSEYWEDRPDGIGMFKIDVKILPNIDSSKESFLIGYKAEIALNSQGAKFQEEERHPIDVWDIFSGDYEVSIWIDLLDEDGFRLDEIFTRGSGVKFKETKRFWDLKPDGSRQIEQAIITSHELTPSLAKRIKKVEVHPTLKKCKEYEKVE